MSMMKRLFEMEADKLSRKLDIPFEEAAELIVEGKVEVNLDEDSRTTRVGMET